MTQASNSYNFGVIRDLRSQHYMTIGDLSDKSGVSTAVISRIERNQSNPELDTLFRIGKAFGMTATDLLSLAENQTAQSITESQHTSEGFQFREVDYSNCKLLYAFAPAGTQLSRPEAHKDVYEICWVLDGHILITLPSEKHELKAGDALQFDAVFEHSYQALKDSQLLIAHLTKGKRF
jgi:transcriptional regulator with XRE-family HTH domain